MKEPQTGSQKYVPKQAAKWGRNMYTLKHDKTHNALYKMCVQITYLSYSLFLFYWGLHNPPPSYILLA